MYKEKISTGNFPSHLTNSRHFVPRAKTETHLCCMKTFSDGYSQHLCRYRTSIAIHTKFRKWPIPALQHYKRLTPKAFDSYHQHRVPQEVISALINFLQRKYHFVFSYESLDSYILLVFISFPGGCTVIEKCISCVSIKSPRKGYKINGIQGPRI